MILTLTQRNQQSGLEKSRKYMTLEGITGIGQFSLTTGAFLAGFVSFLGGSESLNGTLGVIPAAMGVLQIFTVLLSNKAKSRKSLAIKLAIILRVFLSTIYFVPFVLQGLGASPNTMMFGFIICFILAYGANGLISPLISSWIVDITPLKIRGNYLAYRERISLGFVAAFTIILGKILDYYEALGSEFTGFLVVGFVLLLMGVLNIYAVVKCEDIGSTPETRISFGTGLLRPLQDKVFNKVITMNILWNFALFIGIPFIAVYMVETLELSYTYMMSMTVLTTVVRMFFSILWGRHADKKSWFSCAAIALLIMGIVHIIWGFINTDNRYILVPLMHILGGIAWGGAGIALFNIQFLFVKPEIRTGAIGINAAIGGITGIMAVKLGSLFVDKMPDLSLKLWKNFVFSGIQMTFILSGIFVIVTAFYIYTVLRKLKVFEEA